MTAVHPRPASSVCAAWRDWRSGLFATAVRHLRIGDGDATFLHQNFDVLMSVAGFSRTFHPNREFSADRANHRAIRLHVERTIGVVRHLE